MISKIFLTLFYLIFLSSYSEAAFIRDLSFLDKNEISNAKKVDTFFYDNYGRTILFNAIELNSEISFSLQNASKEDLKRFLVNLKKISGTNLIKLPILWEKTNPGTDYLDDIYLSNIVRVIRMASTLDIFVFLSMGQHNFSRYLKGGSYGAPAWVVNGLGIPLVECKENCPLNDDVTKEAKSAITSFWKNASLNTINGKRYIQDEYIWNFKKILQYLKSNLNEKEFSFILGLDPWFNPIPGNIKEQEWKEIYLFAFLQKTKKVLEESGFENKSLIFSFNAGTFLKSNEFLDKFNNLILNPILINPFEGKIIKPKDEKQFEEISKLFEPFIKRHSLLFFSNLKIDKKINLVSEHLAPFNYLVPYSKLNDSVKHRAFPSRLSGSYLFYYYNEGEEYPAKFAFNLSLKETKKHMILAWDATKSDFPAEIHLPSHFDLSKTSLILQDSIFSSLDKIPKLPQGYPNEIFLSADTLYLYDDNEIKENQKNIRFAILFENGESPLNLEEMRTSFKEQFENVDFPLNNNLLDL